MQRFTEDFLRELQEGMRNAAAARSIERIPGWRGRSAIHTTAGGNAGIIISRRLGL